MPIRATLTAPEAARREVTARFVRTNGERPADFIDIKVEEPVGGKPFDSLDACISQDEQHALLDNTRASPVSLRHGDGVTLCRR